MEKKIAAFGHPIQPKKGAKIICGPHAKFQIF